MNGQDEVVLEVVQVLVMIMVNWLMARQKKHLQEVESGRERFPVLCYELPLAPKIRVYSARPLPRPVLIHFPLE